MGLGFCRKQSNRNRGEWGGFYRAITFHGRHSNALITSTHGTTTGCITLDACKETVFKHSGIEGIVATNININLTYYFTFFYSYQPRHLANIMLTLHYKYSLKNAIFLRVTFIHFFDSNFMQIQTYTQIQHHTYQVTLVNSLLKDKTNTLI